MNGESAVRALASEPGAELRETHGSWVVLTDDRALKIKKPVQWSFLDYTTLAARHAACIEEVRINQALAPGIYKGVRPLCDERGQVVCGPLGETKGATEFAVEMRRFDEGLTMAAKLSAGTLEPGDVVAAARRIALFHRTAERLTVEEPIQTLRRQIESDLADLDELGVAANARRMAFANGCLARESATIEERDAAGLIRDGHGDLRAEHILLTEPLAIVDRLEFDPALRSADVADDLAFLTMDLESREGRWAADLVAPAYEAGGGTPAPAPLAAMFAWRRALVRAKVALLQDRKKRVAELMDLAARLEWRARAGGVLVVCGPPASGKSTLATALAERMEVPVVASDNVRKELLGLEPTQRADESGYADAVTHRVYDALADRGRSALQSHGSVIIDANFGRAAARRSFFETTGQVRWVWCDQPLDILAERARRRERDPSRVSDAGPEVAARLASEYEPLDEIPPDHVLRLSATDQASATDDIAAWLDCAR